MKILGTAIVVLLALGQQTIRYDASTRSPTLPTERPAVSEMARTAEALASQPNADTNARLALSIWNDLNTMCRGFSGDRPETQAACCVRSKVDVLLNNLGYCYHMGDTWRKCGPRDRRAQRVALKDCVK